VTIYRREFKPSAQLDAPHVIAGVNVIAADSAAEAQAMFQATKRARVSLFFGGGREFTDDEADMVLDSPQGQHVAQMMRYSAVGTPDAVVDYLADFGKHADADELIVAHQSTGTEARLRSVALLAEAAGLARVGA
jgi:alkanesulfonate monooxygenase SsuD/methylene tetrahydromethanopterin reductase-like flavin-dependent oxidoreductase (luciferase family)